MEPVTPDTFPYLFWGYTVIWAIIVVYLVKLTQRVRRIEARGEESSRHEQ